MKIVIICVLKLIYISTASSQAGILSHICEYIGVNTHPKVDLKTIAADIPKRCELVTYGIYFFNGESMDDKNMYKNDEAAIKSMVAAGIPVYTYVAYNGTEKWIDEIFDPKDPAASNILINSFIQKITELQPTGIVLNIVDLYVVTGLADQIKAFITKLKPTFPKLKFGLTIYSTTSYKKLPMKDLFDFSVTNSIIDLYFVDMNINNYTCTRKLKSGGTPITSPDKNELTFELLTYALTQSGVDIAKTIPCINIFPLTPHQVEIYTPYSKYCLDPNASKTELWCLDKSQRLYDIGAFMKKQNFSGVAVDWLEWDDIPGDCQCEKFPVTNLIFDGWDGKPIKPCAKIG